MRKGGNTMANSTAVVPLTHETRLRFRMAIISQPIRIQLVLVIGDAFEDITGALITLKGNND
jgi:hypothetical protein